MRIRKLARFGGVALAVLGLSGVLVPDASAEGVKTMVFQGTAELNAGLSFPCTPITTTTPPDLTPTKGTKTCPPQKGPGTVSKKDTPFHVNGNTRIGGFGSVVCVGAWAAVDKPEPKGTDTETDPSCTISATFRVTGYCGLSQGRGVGTATIGTNTIQFKFTWTAVSQRLIILGNWWHGAPAPPPPGEPTTPPEGDLVAFARATALPEMNGTTNTNSCIDKSARTFTIDGEATLTHPKCLPGHETNQCPV